MHQHPRTIEPPGLLKSSTRSSHRSLVSGCTVKRICASLDHLDSSSLDLSVLPTGLAASSIILFDILFNYICLPGDLNDAEEVAIGIFQHDEVIIRFIPPGVASRPDRAEPLHLSLLVVGVEVEVQPTPFAWALFRNLVQRYLVRR